MKDLYNENYKALWKEMEDIKKWEIILFSWFKRLNDETIPQINLQIQHYFY